MDWHSTNVGSMWWSQCDKQQSRVAAGRRHIPGTGWNCTLENTLKSLLGSGSAVFYPKMMCWIFWRGICIADRLWTCAKEDFKLTWVGRQPSQRSGRVSAGGLHDKWFSGRNLANCFPVSAARWIVNDQASQDHFHFLYLYRYLQIWIPEECVSEYSMYF